MPVVFANDINRWEVVAEGDPVPQGAIIGGQIIADHLNANGRLPEDENADHFAAFHPADEIARQGRNNNRAQGAQWIAQHDALQQVAAQEQRFVVRPGMLRIDEFNAVFEENTFKAVKGVRGESLFRMILSGIKEVYDVDAVIAGGAVRDFANEIEDYADVDVFLPMKWETFVDDADQLGWEKRPQLVKNKYKKTKKLPTSARAQGRVQGVAVDLVFLDKPLDFEEVAKFPVNAQKCVWTLEGGLSVSPEALADHVAHTFTISPTITDKEAIEHIREKVKMWTKRKGYSKWKIVEPDIKEWWEEKKEIVDEIPFGNKTKTKSIWNTDSFSNWMVLNG